MRSWYRYELCLYSALTATTTLTQITQIIYFIYIQPKLSPTLPSVLCKLCGAFTTTCEWIKTAEKAFSPFFVPVVIVSYWFPSCRWTLTGTISVGVGDSGLVCGRRHWQVHWHKINAKQNVGVKGGRSSLRCSTTTHKPPQHGLYFPAGLHLWECWLLLKDRLKIRRLMISMYIRIAKCNINYLKYYLVD